MKSACLIVYRIRAIVCKICAKLEHCKFEQTLRIAKFEQNLRIAKPERINNQTIEKTKQIRKGGENERKT